MSVLKEDPLSPTLNKCLENQSCEHTFNYKGSNSQKIITNIGQRKEERKKLRLWWGQGGQVENVRIIQL